MEASTKVFLTFTFIVVLITGTYFFTDWFSKMTGYFSGEAEIEKLVLCLNNKNTEFYTSTFCADCEKQANLFGQAIENIHSIDCGKNKEKCPNIREIPAWFIQDNIVYGIKTLEELKLLADCD